MTSYLEKPWASQYSAEMKLSFEVPKLSVPEFFNSMCDKYANKTALIFYGQKISYSELQKLVSKLAGALKAHGIGQGDVVALYLLNSPQYVISYMATLSVGAVVTPVSPVFTSHELKYQLEDSGAKIVVCQDILYDNLTKTGLEPDFTIVAGIDEYLPPLKKLLGSSLLKSFFSKMGLPKPKITKGPKIGMFSELIKNSNPFTEKAAINPETDLASISYSGGTTGPPKGVMLSHTNMIAGGMSFQGFYPHLKAGQEVFPAYLPLYHAYGQLVVMIGGIVLGATLVIFTTPDVDEILDSINKYNISVFFGVPTFYEFLREYDKTSRVNWQKFKLILCGADTLHAKTISEWERRTGAKIFEGYGQTESGGASSAYPLHQPKQGSIGIPLSNNIMAIMNPDQDEFLPPGEVGEIVVNGPNVALGYWRKAEDTAQVFISVAGRKWLRTGDMGYMDEAGFFHYVDRKRDLIKYKGFSIFARDVEEVLYRHPHVRGAGVIGVPDPKVGQLVKACVVLQPEVRGKVSEAEIVEFCKQHLAHYKVPRIVEFHGELPKTDVGKVSRRELREEEGSRCQDSF